MVEFCPSCSYVTICCNLIFKLEVTFYLITFLWNSYDKCSVNLLSLFLLYNKSHIIVFS